METLEITSLEEPSEYPEGGLTAWLVVLGAWCAMISSMGFLNTLAVLQAQLMENELRGMPESTVGWIFSLYPFFLYFCGAQVGPIFDSRSVQWLITPGVIGIVLSVIFTSLSQEFYQFLLSFGVLGGISASLLFNPSVSAIGHWFSKRRALATGIACTAGGIGGIVFPLIILYLTPRVGFPWSMRIIALICAVLGAVACLLLRKRLPPNIVGGSAIDLKSLLEPRFAVTTLAVFLVEFAVFIPYTYISSYAIHAAGMDSQTAYLLNTLLNAGAIPGRALPGYVADRFGVFNTMCVTAVACATIILALWSSAATAVAGSSQSSAMVISFVVLFGFWSGAAISLTPVCIGQVSKTEDYGKRSGTAFCVASLGALIGIPISGAIVQANGVSYQGLVFFSGAFYVAAALAFACVRVMCGGWSPRVVI